MTRAKKILEQISLREFDPVTYTAAAVGGALLTGALKKKKRKN